MTAWVTRDVEALLDQLAATPAVVTVHLASGQRLVGNVLDVVRERGASTVALQSLPQRGASELDITAIAVNRVEAITVHAATPVVKPAALPEVATSSLDLKRRAKVFGERLSEQLGQTTTIEIGGAELPAIAALFEQVKIALDKVCADELGRAALSKKVRTVELAITANPKVALAGTTLKIVGELALATLQRNIDELL